MDKKDAEKLTNELFVADALLRLTTLENLLIAKGVFSKEEFQEEKEKLAKQIARSLLSKAGANDIDDIMKSFNITSASAKKTQGN